MIFCDNIFVSYVDLRSPKSQKTNEPEKNKPAQSYMERYIQLSAVKYVDEIVPYNTEEELLVILNHFPIDIRFIGEDYTNKEFTGNDIHHIKIYYNKRRHDFSTTNLRKKMALDPYMFENGRKFRGGGNG